MTATISTIDTHTLTRQIARPCTKMQNVYIYVEITRLECTSLYAYRACELLRPADGQYIHIHTLVRIPNLPPCAWAVCAEAPQFASLDAKCPPPRHLPHSDSPARRARAESRDDARGGSNRRSRGYIPFLRVLRNQTCGSLHGQSAPCCGARARRPPTRAALRPRLCLHR